jgi:hypothetical protein
MNKATLEGQQRWIKLKLRVAQSTYRERPIKFWQQEVRKYEIALEVINDYKERSDG